jgi:hypothetical protein
VYRVNDTDRVVYVCDDPNIVFAAQADEDVEIGDIGGNANIVFTHAGSTVTGISGAEVDGTISADATFQCNVLRVLPRADNPGDATGNILEVTFNLHQRTTGVGQAGV